MIREITENDFDQLMTFVYAASRQSISRKG